MRHATFGLLAGALAWLAPFAIAAQPLVYAIEEIAREGEPSPDGGVMNQFIPLWVDIDADARVLFHTYVAPSGDEMIVVREGGALHSAVRDYQLAPPPVGLPFAAVGHGRLGAGGSLAWSGWYYSPLDELERGAFARLDGTDAALLVPGQAVPGGGSVIAVEETWMLNAAGEALVLASLDVAGSGRNALMLVRATGVELVAREGDPTPAGGVFGEIPEWIRPWLGPDGTVVFAAEIAGAAAARAVFQRSPSGVLGVLVSQGDPLLSARGGTFEFFFSVSKNQLGELCIHGDVLRPSLDYAEAVVVIGATHREIVAREDVLPGMNGDHFGAGLGPARMNAAGDVLIAAVGDQTGRQGIFVSHGGVLSRVMREGLAVPGHLGETFLNVIEAALNDAGQVAFMSSIGPTKVAMFVATPTAAPVPQVPLAPTWALAALGVTMIASGWRRLARR